ncbi:STAS domain-containing protein [Desulfovibrio sp. JC010]|uniref:STAS domain-containing protein n=1 Tax=Desulfovibrio sp. JC010 TaxID=2593641 RepID=UPI0013D802F0|nr:STAS domain-containing protein [Desulfovibrio sp. JC010]
MSEHADIIFDFTEEDREECLLLCPKGHFNHSTVPLIRDHLYAHCCENGCRIVMCMKDVDMIDSAGLGVMVHAHKACDKYGGMIVFSDFNEMIAKNMKMLSVDKYLNFCPDLQSAFEKLG